MSEHARAQAHLYEFVKNELPDELRQRLETHITSCKECHEEVENLKTFFEGFDTSTVDWSAKQPDEYWNTFAYSVQAKIKKEPEQNPGIIERFAGWLDSFITFQPRDLAVVSAMCAVVVVALIIGKEFIVEENPPAPPLTARKNLPIVDSEYVRLHDYFRRSRALLVGLANAREEEGDELDMQAERTISRNLINEARMLKQQPLDARSERLIGDMERILIKVANSENEYDSPEMQLIRRGIERENLLYKVRRAEATYRQPTIMFAGNKE